MANQYNGEVGFEIAGARHAISFSANALCELEEQMQLTPAQLSEQLAAGLKMTQMREIFLVGIADYAFRNQQPKPSLDDVKMMLANMSPDQMVKLIERGLNLAFPPPPEGGAVRPPEARATAGNGSVSSQPGNP